MGKKKKERREAQGREEREQFERSLGNSRRSSTVVVALPPRSLCLSREVFFSSFFLGLNHFGFGGREEGEREREREREQWRLRTLTVSSSRGEGRKRRAHLHKNNNTSSSSSSGRKSTSKSMVPADMLKRACKSRRRLELELDTRTSFIHEETSFPPYPVGGAVLLPADGEDTSIGQ